MQWTRPLYNTAVKSQNDFGVCEIILKHRKRGHCTGQSTRNRLAKQVFHMVGVDEADTIVWRKRLTQSGLMPLISQLPPVVIGMEACGGAH